MAFKSTTNRTHLRVVREVEAIGGNVTASASREQMGYTYDALKNHMPEMIEVLIDCVRNPIFLDWEVNEQDLLLEALHSAGYSGALANPLMATKSAINRLNGTILEEFVAKNYTASRVVLAASGVEHNELVSIAEPLLSDLPRSPLSRSQNLYMLEVNVGVQQIQTSWWLEKRQGCYDSYCTSDAYGWGGSFSAGGPGKGMYSRLYVRFLNEYQQIQSFSAFNSIYNHSGIFGIHAATGPNFVSKAVDLAARELLTVATPGQVDQVQLDQAKVSTKSAVLMNLESRMVASEDIGWQLLTYGERLCRIRRGQNHERVPFGRVK